MGCETEKGALRSYFYPSKQQVYAYSANDSSGVEYWEVLPQKDGIVTKVYDGKFNLAQESHESFYTNGVNLEKLLLKNTDAEIISGFVFPFEKIDASEVVFYHIKWKVKEDASSMTTYELIRNRRFVGFEDFEYMGETSSCTKFQLDERIISDLDGSIEMKTSGVEYYAEGIGLVYRKRQLNEDLLIEQELLDILTMEEFEEERGKKG